MPQFFRLTDPSALPGEALPAPEGQALLVRLGVCWGQVQGPARDAATDPRMRHARALLELQRHFGEADRVLLCPAPRAPAARGVAGWPLLHPEGLTLVVSGTLAWQLRLPGAAGWLVCRWSALEWFQLPPGLRPLSIASAGPEAEIARPSWLWLQRGRRPGPAEGAPDGLAPDWRPLRRTAPVLHPSHARHHGAPA